LPEYREVRGRARDFVELCLTPALAAELTLQAIRRYGMDGAILFSDILMLPYALGQKHRTLTRLALPFLAQADPERPSRPRPRIASY